MSSAAPHPKPSPHSPGALGGVATRFRLWAEGPTAQRPKKPSDSVRELSYEEALRTHARYQPLARPPQAAQPTASIPQPRVERSNNDGSLLRTAPQTANCFESTIQTQIERLIQNDQERATRWIADSKPATAQPEESSATIEPNPVVPDMLVQEVQQTASNPFLLAFHTAQSAQAAVEESPLIFAEDHTEEEFLFAQQLEGKELPDIATLSPQSRMKSQPVPRFHQEAQLSGKMEALTVRMTPQDCEEVRLRAKEAGLSISAYLRACALEVEQLRSQVKQMIAGLRKEQPIPQPEHDQPSRNASLLSRVLNRFFPLGTEPPGDS